MMDSAFSLLAYRAEQYLLTGELAKPSGCAHALSAPFDAFKTKDGYVIITTANEILFENVCQAMYKPELHQDSRFETDAKRARNNIELKKIIEEWLSSYTTKEAEEILLKYSIPCGHVQTIPEVCNGPQVIARDMIVEVEHPVVGKIKIPGNPIKLSETPAQLKKPAPLLGQHTEEILVKLLGYKLDYVKQLQNEGII
jgi:crotonobetainyl-CoA:carnitine CoA-transferase CaiB-like acyl-CoA transferase